MEKLKIKKIKNTVFFGDKVFLKKLKKINSNSNYLKWMQNPQVIRYLECRNEKFTIRSINNYISSTNKNTNKFLYGIFTNDLKKHHVGNIKIDVDWYHKFCIFGYLLGEQKKYKRRGLTSEAINISCDIAFNNLNMRLCMAQTYKINKGSVKCLLKNSFKLESRINKLWKIDNKRYSDDLTFSLEKKNFKKIF